VNASLVSTARHFCFRRRQNGEDIVATASTPPRYLRARLAAHYTGVTYRTIRDPAWRRRVGIPYARLGSLLLFDRADLDQWIQRRKVKLR
jgi:excisionase family DNA binding protein